MFDTTKVWLITGSARGLGRRIAEAVLEAGHRLAGRRGLASRAAVVTVAPVGASGGIR